MCKVSYMYDLISKIYSALIHFIIPILQIIKWSLNKFNYFAPIYIAK